MMKIKNFQYTRKSKILCTNNTAQVSIFIIIGLVILIAAGVVFYVNKAGQKEEIAPGVFISTKEIPTQLDPVSNFITQCLDDVSTRGLNLIGEHGGYVDISNPQLTRQSFKSNDNPTENDVVVILDYNLEAKKEDISSKVDQFFVRIPVDLQKIYNLATEITNMQQKYNFLERQTMNLISSFASVDEDKLPPITDMRFEFGSTTSWRKSEVREKITSILTSYI